MNELIKIQTNETDMQYQPEIYTKRWVFKSTLPNGGKIKPICFN